MKVEQRVLVAVKDALSLSRSEPAKKSGKAAAGDLGQRKLGSGTRDIGRRLLGLDLNKSSFQRPRRILMLPARRVDP